MAARAAVRSEVNVTPFVDVMLVLLIIFMVAAPLATTKIDLTMPPPGDAVKPIIPPVYVSLQVDGSIHVGSEELGEGSATWTSFGALLREKTRGNLGTTIYVRADRDVNYGDVVRLIDELRAAGYSNISVINEDPGA